ncbi:hypothetical protein BDK51DRAFT_34566 [Blyttiomyces helicus]|uniref:Uncharacterized protein n=1 Tax=Blyttiomyces helicus TaxID=388810 RepID=A0A4P9W8Q6_9FUNG|nr:hypothetical protein BDK51DRAFT_34566 [Blyttiomyces helicus]|eukprot:RKO88522.1 hypothetical protein BDK51DRAFT_34566 [Blyttiomyces helicus]
MTRPRSQPSANTGLLKGLHRRKSKKEDMQENEAAKKEKNDEEKRERDQKQAEELGTTPRFMWGDNSNWQLLALVKQVKDEQVAAQEEQTGILARLRYWKVAYSQNENYLLLANLHFETLYNRNKAVSGTFNVHKCPRVLII